MADGDQGMVLARRQKREAVASMDLEGVMGLGYYLVLLKLRLRTKGLEHHQARISEGNVMNRPPALTSSISR